MAAHLPVDELPTEFDVIVEGTGKRERYYVVVYMKKIILMWN